MKTRGYLFKRWRGKHLSAKSEIEGIFYLAWKRHGHKTTRCLKTRDPVEAERRRQAFSGGLVTDSDEEKYLLSLVELGETARAKLQRIITTGPDLPIKDAWNQYQASRRRPASGPRTLSGYEGQFRRFTAWCKQGVPSMQSVNPEIADQYTHDLEQSGMNAGTVRKHLMFLRLLWKTLLPDAKNPWLGVRPSIPSETTPHRRMDVDEVRALVKKATGEWRTLILIGYTTGLRLYDACHLSWASIDLKNLVITLKPKKTERRKKLPVVIPLLPDLAKLLHTIPKRQHRGYVLPEIAAQYDRDSPKVSKILGNIFESAKVKDTRDGQASYHSLRVCYRSNCDAAGVPVAITRSILGHASEAVSAMYSRPDQAEKRKAVERAIPSVTE
jgi:integrase